MVDGIWVVDLGTLAEFKASYGRAQELQDLKLIETHWRNRGERPGGGARCVLLELLCPLAPKPYTQSP